MTRLPSKIKRGHASLVGGIVVGIAVFALFVAIARNLGVDGAAPIIAGLLVAAAIATWIRLADL